MVEHLVLLSGGYESAGCLLRALAYKPFACFVDYGQPYLEQEVSASLQLCRYLSVPLVTVSIDRLGSDSSGVFPNRNERLLEAAMQQQPKTVWFGCRAPLALFDRHGDSNRQWARRMARKYGIQINTPFIGWPKFLVKHYVHRSIPRHLIYSSEGFDYAKNHIDARSGN